MLDAMPKKVIFSRFCEPTFKKLEKKYKLSSIKEGSCNVIPD